jgi:L-ascorbate metabolism protein UlaG (beta-lactamase superfamily)
MREVFSALLLAGLAAAPGLSRPTAGLPAVETIPARGGPIRIQPITHASAQIEHGGKVIQLDPWSQGDYSRAKPADLILITDVHPDHLDPAALAKLRKAGTVIVGPEAVARQLPGVTVVRNGERKTIAGVSIEAVPMYNLQRGPAPGQLFHTKGRGNGYVLTLGGKRLYFSGDTENIPEVRRLKNIDVAFVCMNLPYTMTPAEAAAMVRAFRPRIVYPYHYRGSDLEAFRSALRGTPVEVRLRDWYPAPASGQPR